MAISVVRKRRGAGPFPAGTQGQRLHYLHYGLSRFRAGQLLCLPTRISAQAGGRVAAGRRSGLAPAAKAPVRVWVAVLFPLDEITCLNTSGRKAAIQTSRQIEHAVSLQIERGIPESGLRLSHFSCLVNLSHVTRVEWDTLTPGIQANPFPPAAVFSRLYGPLCGISEIRTPPFPETGTAEFFYARVSGSSRAVLAEKTSSSASSTSGWWPGIPAHVKAWVEALVSLWQGMPNMTL